MARDKGQVFIFNDAELKLIQVTFADNEALIYSVRKVLLQAPLSPAEKELVKQSMTPEVFAVIKKRLFPDFDYDSPLTQIADYRSIITNDIKSKPFEDSEILLDSLDIEIAYFEQQFERLKDVTLINETVIDLQLLRNTFGKEPRRRHVELRAYLDILGYVDPQLNHLKVIAGTKEETLEQKKNRMSKDSNK
jgi:hypothetical protein